MKKISLLLLSLFAASSTFGEIRISILGDSYSTFAGHTTPKSNKQWYPSRTSHENRVIDLEKTWWKLVEASNPEFVIDHNNSYSGATICCTGYGQVDAAETAFVTRMMNLGKPDIIFIFGGTNDAWCGAPKGEFQYDNFTKEALMQFRPAFAYLLSSLKTLYPKAKIINIVNEGLVSYIPESMEKICAHYGVTNVVLKNIGKEAGHPDVNGMRAICDQLLPHLK